jgi:glutamate-ammonia-ligase adenylyltransferase
MTDLAHLTDDLPDPDAARRFLSLLEERHPRDKTKLLKNDGLLSDALTLAAYSPLLSTTLLQNPEYLWWLSRKKNSPSVRTKDELMEALGRFLLTHSQLDLHTQLARFRRRELLRIFLSDIRRLATIAEITEDISNLADAILETALRRAEQEMDNRFGKPQTRDEKGRVTNAEFCIVSPR